MKVNTGSFVKKDGSVRDMYFVRLKDLPKHFLDDKISGKGIPKKYEETSEIVWDIDNNDFRIFNWKTVTGTVTQVKI